MMVLTAALVLLAALLCAYLMYLAHLVSLVKALLPRLDNPTMGRAGAVRAARNEFLESEEFRDHVKALSGSMDEHPAAETQAGTSLRLVVERISAMVAARLDTSSQDGASERAPLAVLQSVVALRLGVALAGLGGIATFVVAISILTAAIANSFMTSTSDPTSFVTEVAALRTELASQTPPARQVRKRAVCGQYERLRQVAGDLGDGAPEPIETPEDCSRLLGGELEPPAALRHLKNLEAHAATLAGRCPGAAEDACTELTSVQDDLAGLREAVTSMYVWR